MACEIKDPTNNPICSDSIKDLKDNAIIMDQYINSEEFEVPDRLGIPRKTWAGLEEDVRIALSNLDPRLEQLIAEKIIAQGGVEIINDWDQASDENVFSAGFVSKRINQDADGNTIIKSGAQTFTFPSEGGEIVTDRILLESTPIGSVQAYIGGNAPNDKWLLCRGQSFSAESYPDLAQLLPDLKIPDLRGVALRGLDANRGFDPSRELLSYQEDAMQRITGKFNGGASNASSNGAFVFHLDKVWNTSLNLVEAGGYTTGIAGAFDAYELDSSRQTRTNSQNETTMKNVAVNFIIKAR